MAPSRRNLLARAGRVAALLAGAGLLPARAAAERNRGAFEALTPAAALKALGVATPSPSEGVRLTAPDVAENGAAVPVSVSVAVELAGVQRLAILVEKNPTALVAVFDVTDAVEPAIGTRIKMAESSNVVAAAFLADGRVLYAQKDVKVTLGGCG